MKIYKDFEIRELIADLQKKPEKHLALDIDQKADILEYIQNEIFKHTKEAFEIIDMNPNYLYPAGVTDKLEYWLNRSLSHLLYIQKLIQQQPPAKDSFAKSVISKPKETDFWTIYNSLELESLSAENEINLWPFLDSLIYKAEETVLKDSEAGLVYIYRNLNKIEASYKYLQHLRSVNPAKGEFAGLQSILQSLADSLLLILKDYYPDTLNDQNILSFAEKHCSFQIYEGIMQSKTEPIEIDQTIKSITETLDFQVIALVYVWNELTITYENCKDIAISFGHKAERKESGKKLVQHYTFFRNTRNRLSIPNSETEKTMNNKIELFEKVIKTGFLTVNGMERANNDLERLKGIAKK